MFLYQNCSIQKNGTSIFSSDIRMSIADGQNLSNLIALVLFAHAIPDASFVASNQRNCLMNDPERYENEGH